MIPEFKIREKKTFANYRCKAVVLMNEYSKFRKNYADNELDKWLNKYRIDHIQEFEDYSSKFKEDNNSSFIKDFTSKHEEYFIKSFEAKDLEIQGIEMFLLYNPDSKNASVLCEILFENCDLNFTQARDENEYIELVEWLLEQWDFFLENHKRLNSSDLLVKRLRRISQSQANPA